MQHSNLLIAIEQESDVMIASISVMKMAEQFGMTAVECTLCATAVSELATNIIRYAGKGTIQARYEQNILSVVAKDQGPGIEDVALAVQEGHSGGSGLGMGLSGVARIMDSMDIDSIVGKGTCVTVSKAWGGSKRSVPAFKAKQRRLDDAVLIRPMPGESACGDGAFSMDIPSYRFMALWDVSGHGEEAERLSKKVEQFIRSRSEKSPHILLRDLHEKFRGTRGLVAVIGRLSPSSGLLEYSGIGNVSLLHFHHQGMRRLPLQEGVIGYNIRTPKSERLKLEQNDTLIMHSDGIQTIRGGLSISKSSRAKELVNIISRDHRAKQADDVSCLVMRYKVQE